MNAWLVWIGIFLIVEVLLLLLQWPVRRSEKKWLKIVIFIVKLLVFAFVSASLISLDSNFMWHFNKPLGALHCALFGDLAVDIVFCILWIFRRKKASAVAIALVSLIAGAGVFAYATVNGQQAVIREATVTSDKLNQDYSFALVTDTHIGTSKFYGAYEKNLAKAAALDPDFVILTGDIVDDFATKDQMEYAFEAINKYFVAEGIPVYYIYGNHDRQFLSEKCANGHQYTYDEIADTIEKNGIIAAEDEYIEIGDDLIFLGRQDETEESRMEGRELAALNPNPEAFLILADHSPLDRKSPEELGADLELSGHTHAGQIFLSQLMEALFPGAPGYGEFHYGDSTLIVSAGTGGWGPVRTREHTEIWNIHLQKQD